MIQNNSESVEKEDLQKTFLIKIDDGSAFLSINGRASFQNSSCLNDFFDKISQEAEALFIDFQHCTSLDSTVLGLIAGVAISMKQRDANVVLCRLSQRNLELIKNLGLDKILTISDPSEDFNIDDDFSELDNLPVSRLLLYNAHMNLVDVEQNNLDKFQDALEYLKKKLNID